MSFGAYALGANVINGPIILGTLLTLDAGLVDNVARFAPSPNRALGLAILTATRRDQVHRLIGPRLDPAVIAARANLAARG